MARFRGARSMKARFRAWAYGLTALTVLGLAGAGGCAPWRAIEAVEVLGDIAAGPKPSRLKRITPEPRRDPVAYVVAGRRRQGDLYRPGESAKAALVLVPGIARAGKDDPRLVALANTLARARFTVLVPDIENLRALRVSPADAVAIADAINYLAGHYLATELPAGGNGGRGEPATVGLIAISYAAGPAVLAALRPDTRRRVRFVFIIGGYYDSEAVLTFFTTGYYRDGPNEPWLHRTPNAYGKWVFVKSNAGRISDPGDGAVLERMAERKMANLGADITDLVAALGAEGRAVYALLANSDPARVPALIAALPEGVRADIMALDIKRQDLSKIEARLILVHGRDDAIIPYSESKALAAAAPEGQAALYVVDSLAHVDLGAAGLIDTLILWRAAYRLLSEREED
ncbi:MAG: alpha/beta hydrolase [Alphaproteobacteria bacterium]|nr:MAG: alpha/beta hydrolase [Alphaproteobacteria bacterium]